MGVRLLKVSPQAAVAPKPMPAIDYLKVGVLQEQHCPRCGVFHGDFFKGRLDIKNGRALCHACGKFRGNVKAAVPRIRREAARPPAIVYAAPVSSPRPREHRALPHGRDGAERDDGSGDGDGDGDGGGEPPPPRSRAPFPGRSVR